MWQKARLLDPEYHGTLYLGNLEIWVKGPPEPIPADWPIRLRNPKTGAYVTKDNRLYYITNYNSSLGSYTDPEIRICKEAVELLAEFAEDVEIIDVSPHS